MQWSDDCKKYIADQVTWTALNQASDCPTVLARSGMPTMVWNGLRLHSAVQPESEMAETVTELEAFLESLSKSGANRTISVVVLSPGLGYLVKAVDSLIKRQNNRTCSFEIICVEKTPEIARKALQLRVWEPIDIPCKWVTLDAMKENPALLPSTKDRVVIRSTPGYRADKSAYDSVLQTESTIAAPERPMRILVPTPMYGGSYPIAGYCASAFEQLGHQVELLDLAPFYTHFKAIEGVTTNPQHRRQLQGMLSAYLAELIVARASSCHADLVWCVAQSPMTVVGLNELRELGIKTAFWFVEDAAVFRYWKDLAAHFDSVFTIQSDAVIQEFKNSGVKHCTYLPCAADINLFRPLQLTADQQLQYASSISFLGAGYRNRQTAFSRLAIPELAIWGNDWPANSPANRWVRNGNHRVTPEEAVIIYNATEINLNLHSSNSHDDVNPNGDFVNPRTFEIAACNAFQLVDSRSLLTELFVPGSEMITYGSTAELSELISYYRTHPDQRTAIAERARSRVVSEHTYVHRMRSALNVLEAQFPALGARRRGPNYVSSILKAAEGDQEITEFLSQFDPDSETTLDEIVARIDLRKAKLGRAEALFLLMKEFRDWGREKGVIA